MKISPLDAHLGYWLRYVSNHVSHAFSRKLENRGVSAAEWVVMRELYDHESRAPSAIAKALGLTRGAISKLANRLVAKSLITRTAGDTDRRYQALALTPEGRGLVPDFAALADRNDEEFFGHLDPATREALKEAMRDIVRHHDMRTIPTE